MVKTRKIQVTLEEAQYDALAKIAERDGKKMAAVVRESIVEYCLGPESKRAKERALKALLAESAPPPEEYGEWEQQYLGLKSEERRPRRGKRERR